MTLGSNTSGHLFDTSFTTDGVLYSAANGVITSTSAGTATQVLTSNGPGVAPTFQAAASGAAVWTDQSGALSAASGANYFITGTSTATLPAVPSQGDTIRFTVDTTQILTVTANTGQVIRLGSSVSSTAGTVVSTARGDAITLVYRSTGTAWIADSGFTGNWTIT